MDGALQSMLYEFGLEISRSAEDIFEDTGVQDLMGQQGLLGCDCKDTLVCGAAHIYLWAKYSPRERERERCKHVLLTMPGLGSRPMSFSLSAPSLEEHYGHLAPAAAMSK